MRTLLRASAAAALTLGLAGCNSLLEQTAPSRVLAENLTDPASAKLIVDGARAAFGCSLHAFITAGGLLTDELEDAQLGAAQWDYDRRTFSAQLGNVYAESGCDVTQSFGIYRPIQTARYQADVALKTIKEFTDAEVQNRSTLLATAALYSGFSHQLLGEAFCTAAISAPDEILTSGGSAELGQAEIFAQAEARFSEALTFAQQANNATLTNAARAGRARARLYLAKPIGGAVNSAKLAEARADAAAVPAGFSYVIPYNAATAYSQNLFTQRNKRGLWYSVAAPYRGLTFGGVADPRVSVTNSGSRGQDATTIVWIANKYPELNTGIQLTDYNEAQLIIAEIDGGQSAVNIINALHTAAGLPPFSSTDPAAIQAQVIQERSREFFLEGQHMYDVRRFNLALNPPAGTPYPNKGGTYGDQRCFLLPDVERSYNPKLNGQ
jgi:hypothetical protein